MDGEKNGLNPFLMDDLGGNTPIFGNIHVYCLKKNKNTSTIKFKKLQ